MVLCRELEKPRYANSEPQKFNRLDLLNHENQRVFEVPWSVVVFAHVSHRAHDVEDTFWYEIEVPVKSGKKMTGKPKREWQPRDLTDAELNALVQAKIMELRA